MPTPLQDDDHFLRVSHNSGRPRSQPVFRTKPRAGQAGFRTTEQKYRDAFLASPDPASAFLSPPPNRHDFRPSTQNHQSSFSRSWRPEATPTITSLESYKDIYPSPTSTLVPPPQQGHEGYNPFSVYHAHSAESRGYFSDSVNAFAMQASHSPIYHQGPTFHPFPNPHLRCPDPALPNEPWLFHRSGDERTREMLRYVESKNSIDPLGLPSEVVHELRDDDVLCGRGAPSNYHPGNQRFKQLVCKYQSSYIASRRSDKPEIAMKVVRAIRDQGGRFLKRTKISGMGSSGPFCWTEIGEQSAYEKACQALRENAPELRRRLASKELAAISSGSQSQMEDSQGWVNEGLPTP